LLSKNIITVFKIYEMKKYCNLIKLFLVTSLFSVSFNYFSWHSITDYGHGLRINHRL